MAWQCVLSDYMLLVKPADPARAVIGLALVLSLDNSVDPLGLGLDELDFQERVGRDSLESDVALGVNQEGGVEGLALEVVGLR